MMMNGNPMMGGGGMDPEMLKALQLAMAQGASGGAQPGMNPMMGGQRGPMNPMGGGQGMDAATMLAMMRQRMGGGR